MKRSSTWSRWRTTSPGDFGPSGPTPEQDAAAREAFETALAVGLSPEEAMAEAAKQLEFLLHLEVWCDPLSNTFGGDNFAGGPGGPGDFGGPGGPGDFWWSRWPR